MFVSFLLVVFSIMMLADELIDSLDRLEASRESSLFNDTWVSLSFIVQSAITPATSLDVEDEDAFSSCFAFSRAAFRDEIVLLGLL